MKHHTLRSCQLALLPILKFFNELVHTFELKHEALCMFLPGSDEVDDAKSSL